MPRPAAGGRRAESRSLEERKVRTYGNHSLDNRWAYRWGFGKLIMPGRDPGGIIVTTLIGMAGALVGGFLVQGLLGLHGGGFIWSIVVATLGAIILLAIYRVLVGQRRA